jgi:hypothetical protein
MIIRIRFTRLFSLDLLPSFLWLSSELIALFLPKFSSNK